MGKTWWKFWRWGKSKKGSQPEGKNAPLWSGVDTSITNSHGRTALQEVSHSSARPEVTKQMRLLLREATYATQARAVQSYRDTSSPENLPFREGDIITVLEQNTTGRWKGVILQSDYNTRTGYFPASAVVLLERPVGGMSRQSKPAQIRKVPPPTVPETQNNRHSGSSFSSGYGSLGVPDNRSSYGEEAAGFPPPPSPAAGAMEGTGGAPGGGRLATSASHSPGPQSSYTTFSFPSAQLTRVTASPGAAAGSGKEFVPHFHNHLYQHQQSDDQGIDVQSPGRDSPSSAGSSTSSFGCRNSTSSLDSGRASSAFDSRTSASSSSHPPSVNRLSGQSYESGGSYRQSYHSSSSSLGSLEKDDVISHINVQLMLADGMKDSEVLNAWLTDFHFEEYYHLFISAGYDMPTVSRMTPEDLTAIGITKPAHRRKLKAEIARLHISDGIPEFVPDSLDRWLHLLRLGEYTDLLRAQGYTTVQLATEITWEDLEEIGISRLGHQKKITLAIKRAKDILSGRRVANQHPHQYTTQEIAIQPAVSPGEPTYQELRTFHHQASPVKDPGWYQGFSHYRPLPLPAQQLHVQVENPSVDEPPPPPAPQTQQQYFQQQQQQQQRYVLNWDVTPTNETTPGTLPRPRGQFKPRPVAKIPAKTRDADTSASGAPGGEYKNYNSLPRDPVKRREALRPQFSTPQTTPKRQPPAPPRRSEELLEAARQDFPPPPLPLVIRDPADNSDTSDCESSSTAICRPARNDSSASFKSTSSAESDSFPFANDNAGTIKQRQQRPQVESGSCSSPTSKCVKSPVGSDDVLTDIGSMLADLTDELDAMLELETTAQ